MKLNSITKYLLLLFSVILLFTSCDIVDEDEEQEQITYYKDNDGDGYGDVNVIEIASSPPSGYVEENTDCDDTDATIYPGAPEICYDGMDNNCDGVNDEACTIVQPVTSATGRVWMDRNLGASQVATSSTDAASYGDLYQWGRAGDGHQIRTSGTTNTLSSSDTPGHGNFIYSIIGPHDWRDPQNNNLWQGVNGVNCPCPEGYRLPTAAELDAERLSWSSNNAAGAFASPLKLPAAGSRFGHNGWVDGAGSDGNYWHSTWSTLDPLRFASGYALMNSSRRTYGISVRCIKD